MSDRQIWINLFFSFVVAFVTTTILFLGVKAFIWLIESNNEEWILAVVVFVVSFVASYNELNKRP